MSTAVSFQLNQIHIVFHSTLEGNDGCKNLILNNFGNKMDNSLFCILTAKCFKNVDVFFSHKK